MRFLGATIFFLLTWLPFGPPAPAAAEDYSSFTIPLLRYPGGNFNPRPEALRSLLAQVAARTSIEVNREPVVLEATDARLYCYPFLYMGGNEGFRPFSAEALAALRNYLSFGGFLFIDDNSGKAGSAFDTSVRKLIADLFPKNPLQKIPRDHSIYRSFYLINQPAGRVRVNAYLEGLSIKGRTVIVYSANDQGGAWSRDKLGNWNHGIIAGGYQVRQHSIRLGVNIVMYALTLDYKKDMVHLPIILERLRRYHSQ
ncbi:MAG: DUF4159 domain-containing protein [Nitrospinaceae bacterium]|nr:MAG: DUF4159 domain-containing protein [Nitrospinaceae bacterium]